MDDTRLPKKIINYKYDGTRNIARPQKRWEDDFREEETGQRMSVYENLNYLNVGSDRVKSQLGRRNVGRQRKR